MEALYTSESVREIDWETAGLESRPSSDISMLCEPGPLSAQSPWWTTDGVRRITPGLSELNSGLSGS